MLLNLFICAATFCLSSAFAKNISYSQLIPCESDSYFFGEKCYKRFASKVEHGLIWERASAYCHSRSGSLVTIDTQELQDFLTAFILLQLKLNVWIGLTDGKEESVYYWDDGSPVNYTNWGPTEPSGEERENEDCVELRYKHHGKTAVWNDAPCSYLAPFICQSDKSEKDSSHDSRFCTIEKGGGFKYFNSCYHFVHEEKSWDDAEEYCQENFKGHLLTIFGPMEEMFLKYITSDASKEFWIGIKIEDPNQLKWTSGWHAVYNNWSNEHKDVLSGTCAVLSKQIRWTSAPCSEMRPFICEVSSDKPIVLDKGPEGGICSNEYDWRDLGGNKCFTFEHGFLKWDEANAVCMGKGGTLAVIESKEETMALHRYVEPHRSMYIGLHRSSTDEDDFEWVDGTEIDYENWRSGEPNNKDEKCVALWTDNMEWNDGSCDNPLPFICSSEKMIVKCTETIHGCCADNKTFAVGPDQAGCPMISCEDTVHGCCPDGNTTAEGPDKAGCSITINENCRDTDHGCCPDGKTAAEGPDNAGCPMILKHGCINTVHGCCPDGKTAAEGPETTGCPMILKQSCKDTVHGCCPDGKTAAEGPGKAGCQKMKSYIKIIIAISVCAILMLIVLGVVFYCLRSRNVKHRKFSTELEDIH